MVSAQVRLALQAMRYYRLWIYASNLFLMAGVLIFTSTAFALLSDPRRQLLPPAVVSPHQPSAIYAYAALFLQGGILPVIGCIGALRLSERLLNSYWILLLLLLAGDVIVGLVWVFRFQRLVAGLVPDLKHRLASEYGTGESPDFDAAWDLLQRSARCCGVESPADYNNSAWLANLADRPAWQPPSLTSNRVAIQVQPPSSSSSAPKRQQHHGSSSSNSGGGGGKPLLLDQRVSRLPLPDSCCKSNSLTGDQLRGSGFLTAVSSDIPPGRKEVYGTGKHRQQLRDYNERYNERMMREQLHRQREQQKHREQMMMADHNVTYVNPLLRYPRRASTTTTPAWMPTTTAPTMPVPASAASRRHHHHNPGEYPTSIRSGTEEEGAEVMSQGDHDDDEEEDEEEECGGVWPSVSDSSDVHEAGCAEFVLSWLHRTGDSLFVLGYCVLAFVKLCFLGILRYELREMVQKIKILQAEQLSVAGGLQPHSSVAGLFHCGILSAGGGQQQQQRSLMAPPPALVATEAVTESDTMGDGQPDGSGDGTASLLLTVANGDVPSGNTLSSGGGLRPVQRQSSFSQYSLVEQLFSPPETPVHRLVQQLQDERGNDPDSDSGSHCALLPSSVPVQRRVHNFKASDWGDQPGEEPGDNRPASGNSNGWPGSRNGNNNEYHELREIKQTQI